MRAVHHSTKKKRFFMWSGSILLIMILVFVYIFWHDDLVRTIPATMEGTWRLERDFAPPTFLGTHVRSLYFTSSHLNLYQQKCKDWKFSEEHAAVVSEDSISFPRLDVTQHFTLSRDQKNGRQLLTVTEPGPLWAGVYEFQDEECNVTTFWYKRRCGFAWMNFTCGD